MISINENAIKIIEQFPANSPQEYVEIEFDYYNLNVKAEIYFKYFRTKDRKDESEYVSYEINEIDTEVKVDLLVKIAETINYRHTLYEGSLIHLDTEADKEIAELVYGLIDAIVRIIY